jgi:hypothetical protein
MATSFMGQLVTDKASAAADPALRTATCIRYEPASHGPGIQVNVLAVE